MVPEIGSRTDSVEIKTPDSPGGIIAGTRGLIIKTIKGVVLVGTLLATMSGCAANEDRLERSLKPVLVQTNSAACTIAAMGPNPPTGEINNIDSDEKKPIGQEGVMDLENVPTEAKKAVWKQYLLELEADLINGGGHYSVYLNQNGEKVKIGELTSFEFMQFITPGGFVKSGLNVYKLVETEGTVEEISLGVVLVSGTSTYKEEYFLIRYFEGGERKVAAIDPNNPSQILKEFLLPSESPLSGENEIDYHGGTLAAAVENKVLVYKDLPEGIDWMNNPEQFLQYQVEIDFAIHGLKVINGHTFVLNPLQIGVISPEGQFHSINKNDINGSAFQSFERIGERLHVVAMPSFKIATWPDPFNPTFPYIIEDDPGENSSNYTHCAATTPEFLSTIVPIVNPETGEDVYIYDALEEIGVDTEIYPDIDPADVITPPDVQPDTPIEDTLPDLPPPDVQPDTPIEDIQPDLPPPDVETDTPDVPLDIPTDTQTDTLDLFADNQFDEFDDDAGEETTTPDSTTPDSTTKPETTQKDQTNPIDNKPKPDTPQTDADEDLVAAEPSIETEPPHKGGKTGCTTSDTPGSPLGIILLGTAAGVGAVALRRKEDDPIPEEVEKAA